MFTNIILNRLFVFYHLAYDRRNIFLFHICKFWLNGSVYGAKI